MMKKYLKQLFQWLIAFIIGFSFINLICYMYEWPARTKPIPNGISSDVRQPNTILVHGTEGYSIVKTDKNGYMNPDRELADKYVLMLGASHTTAREVPSNKKYSVLVNDFYNDDKYLHTYNIAHEGNFLPSQIKHFAAAMEAFPNAEAVTIEIYSTDYTAEEIAESMVQAKYDSQDSAQYYYNASFIDNIKIYMRYLLPLWEQFNSQKTALKARQNTDVKEPMNFDGYGETINDALSLIRSEYEGPLVFVYHPEMTINQDGSISLIYSQTWDLFCEACSNNHIDVIDVGPVFVSNYETNMELPYGFFNTTLGNGHLNKVGHRIIAEEIINYLNNL